jgi:hypothetical protein
VLKGCVATVSEMEACTEPLSVHFKQRAMIEILIAAGICPIEIHCQMQVVYVNDC